MNEPLLSSLNTGGSTLTVAGGGPVSLRDSLRATWNKLKFSMICIFIIAIIHVGTLMYGCIEVARASNSNIGMQSSLNADIASFLSGGLIRFNQSKFDVESGPLTRSIDPYQAVVEENAGTPYTSSIFIGRSLTLKDYANFSSASSCVPLSTSSPSTSSPSSSPIVCTGNASFNDSSENNTISIAVYSYFGSTQAGTFFVTVPYYQIDIETSLQQGPKQCAAQGGFYDKTAMQCITLFVLSHVCVKVTNYSVNNTSNEWRPDASLGGYGCDYPFETPGIYVKTNYTPDTTDLLKNTFNFTIRSSDDPYISLQKLSKGVMSLSAVVQAERNQGIHLIILAFVVIIVSLSLGLMLHLFKRKVKHQYRTVSRIPRHYSRPPMFRYLALSIACFGIAIGAGFPLLSHWSELLAWTYTPFAGLLMILYAGPLGMVSLLIFWQQLLKTPAWSLRVRSILGGAVGAVLMVMCAFAVGVLMKPWRFVYSTEPGAPDAFQVFFGIIVVLTFFPIATLMLVLCAHILYKESPKNDDNTKSMLSSNFITRRAFSNSSFAIFGLSVLFVVFLATAFLPPIWNVVTVGSYNIMQSPYSIVPANNSNFAVIKLYLDVVVFYGFVFAVVIVGILASVSRPMRRALSYWVRVRIGSVFVDTSFGEMCFIGLVVGLAIWWFCWWFWWYDRIAQIPDTLERLARVLGHMTNLFASLLLFPITRNSIWVEIVGIPFERAVKYHRWAGLVTFFALTSHMLVWWVQWSQSGNLLHNIFTMQNSEHPDNWSIPMVELTWLGAAIMVLLSQNWFRRRRFEVFYYTHHFFIVFFVTGLIHAWSLWYFCGGGMILWFVDRLIRFYKSSQALQVTDIQLHGETTQLTLQPSGFAFRAGQYAFINIPSITPLEWHPFTISSAPGEARLTFHIKNMGKNTWTSRLARVYGGDGLSYASLTSLPIVNIDGPYGNPPDFTKHANIILVAGGIGITPIISILKDIHMMRRQNDSRVRYIRNVYLLWTVRDVVMLYLFRDIFNEIISDYANKDVFHFMFHVTQRSFASKGVVETTPIVPHPVLGRPRIHQEFAQIATKCGRHVLTMVCGPTPLVNEAQSAAYAFGFDFHMETFEL